MSKKTLNWKFSLTIIQQLTELSHRWELFHFKIFECKAYSLLKKINAFSRVQKLKSRAFVKYLIEYDFINIFKIWNFEKKNVSEYKNVIFDETKFYDSYQKTNLMTKSEKKELIEFNIYQSRKSVSNEINEKWLNLSICHHINESIAEKADQSIEIKTSANIQLFTLEYTSISSKIRPSLLFINQTSLNIIETAFRRNVNLTNINEFNVIEEKRTRKINSKYANIVYLNDEIWSNEAKTKISHFYAVFFAVIKFQSNDIQFHREQLSNESNHWRAMLKHLHVKDFLKATKIEWDALNEKRTWEVVDKSINVVILFFKWVFIYKFDSNDYLTKYKTRLIVREDLQDIIDQNGYAAILTFKIFRVLMILIVVFNLKIQHLNLVNAF